MARAINVALSGPRAYEGQMQNFPLVHPTGSLIAGPADIDAACLILWKAWGFAVIITAFVAIL
jgi:adenosylcobinamide-phosphate synthase